MSIHHRIRFLGLAALILVGSMGLTGFGTMQRADARRGVGQVAALANAVATPILQSPKDNICATGTATFSWRSNSAPLAANQAFEVRLWKAGQRRHVGLATPLTGTTLRTDLRLAPAVQQSGSGRYLWTVARVQLAPYEQIGQEAAPRRLYIDLTKPANSPCIVPGSPTNTPDVSGFDTPAAAPKRPPTPASGSPSFPTPAPDAPRIPTSTPPVEPAAPTNTPLVEPPVPTDTPLAGPTVVP